MPKDRKEQWWRDREDGATGPREARGGIKAHSRRGAFGRTWWARRWLDVLERLDLGGRLDRGRAYARRGQVLDVRVEEGVVRATVQGSRREPYVVTVRVAPLGTAAWRRVAGRLREEARFAARLLASEMPEDVEEAFTATGVSLFPAEAAELVTECSCPDWSNPCKHIAAVHYLLGEEFDRDPFLVFRLRGLDREGLVALLETAPPTRTKTPPAEPVAASEALTADPDAFWSGGGIPPVGEVRALETSGALLRRLGPFPFWRGRVPLADALEAAYAEASSRALAIYAGRADGTTP